MKKLYAAYPGFIRSRNDGQHHFISMSSLASLHRVPLAACVDADRSLPADLINLTPLRPRYDGKYPNYSDRK